MKKTTFLFIILTTFFTITNKVFSQSKIVFTSIDENSGTKFWSVNTDAPMVYYNISEQLDLLAPYQGSDEGPVTVSHDGNYYAFLSDRFDAEAAGWPALTIVKTDFSQYFSVKDEEGNLIHSEGQAYVFNNGTAVVYTADFGNHDKDIFVSYQTGSGWSTPLNLTQNSNYNYNYWPYLTSDSSKVLFDAGNSSFPGTAAGLVNIDGTDLTFPVTTASFSDATEIHSPGTNSYGDIIFEAETSTGGEQIWKLPANGNTPVLINGQYSNDNSPVVLPDDKIASLYLPNSYHQLKVMDADGSNGILLTDSSALFLEVFDIGLSACLADNTTTIAEKTPSFSPKIFPNPASDYLNIGVSYDIHSIEIYSPEGKIMFQKKHSSHSLRINVSAWPSGEYSVKIKTTNGKTAICKTIIKK